jgi:hypothetical protein
MTGRRRRNRRAAAEAKWRTLHLRQAAIYAKLMDEPDACYYAANLRRMA